MAIVTGIVGGGGLLELWYWNHWTLVMYGRLMIGKRTFQGERMTGVKARDPECLVCSEDGQHLLGLQVRIHELWVDIRLVSTFRLYSKCHHQVHLSVLLRRWDICLGGIRESFPVLKQNIDLIKYVGKFK